MNDALLRGLSALLALITLLVTVLMPVGWAPLLNAGASALLATFAVFGFD